MPRSNAGSSPQLHRNIGGEGGCKLNEGGGTDASSTVAVNVDENLTAAAVLVWEAKAIGGESYGCEGEEAKYGTLGANPMVL